MVDPGLYNPHTMIYIRAEEVERANEPPVVPQLLELRRSFDLGHYTVEKLTGLIDELEECLEEWVANNPPEGE